MIIKNSLAQKGRISEGKTSATRRTSIKSRQSVVLELSKIDERYYRQKCSCPISEETWLNHFQSFHSNDPRTSMHYQEVYDKLLSLEKEKGQLNYLDQKVAEQKLRQAVKKLKNKKLPFVDKIRNEMIKASLESLMPIYIKLFNLILQCAKMPDIWCQGLMTPIYKSGDKSDPTNYRGICVSSGLGKLFCSILIKDYTCILKKTGYYITPKLAFYLKIALQTLFSF